MRGIATAVCVMLANACGCNSDPQPSAISTSNESAPRQPPIVALDSDSLSKTPDRTSITHDASDDSKVASEKTAEKPDNHGHGLTAATRQLPGRGINVGGLLPLAALEEARKTELNPPAEVTELKGNTKGVNQVRFDPTGKFLLSAGDDGIVRVWSTVDWTLVEQYRCVDGVTGALWLKGGDVLVAATAKGELFLFRSGNPEPQQRFMPPRNLVWLEFLSFRTVTIGQSDDEFVTVAEARRNKHNKHEISFDVTCLWRFSEFGAEFTARTIPRTIHSGGIWSGVAPMRNGRFAVRDRPGIWLIPALNSPESPIVAFGPQDRVTAIAISPDESLAILASESECKLSLWDLGSHSKVRDLGQHAAWINDIAFLSPTTFIAGGGFDVPGLSIELASEPFDPTVSIWSIETGKELQRLRMPAPVTSIALSPDGQSIAVGIKGDLPFPRSVYVWRTQLATPLGQLIMPDDRAPIHPVTEAE